MISSIYTDRASHMWVLKFILWALAEHGWKVSPSKCIFVTHCFHFLGIAHDTSRRKMFIDKERIGNISRWRVPRSYQEVGSRLAMLNWMKRFIILLKTEALPLHLMVVKKEFEWKAIHQRAWENVISTGCTSKCSYGCLPQSDFRRLREKAREVTGDWKALIGLLVER